MCIYIYIYIYVYIVPSHIPVSNFSLIHNDLKV